MSQKPFGALGLPVVLSGKLLLGAVSVIATMRGDFGWAAWGLALAALLDLLDPPRLQPTLRELGPGGRMKILVGALCFGVVPAFVAHEVFLNEEPWGWVLATFYAVSAAINVARSRIEPDRRSKPTTQGLPAPASAAGLAAIQPFLTGSVVAPLLGGLPSTQEVGGIMICLLILMLSPVTYRVAPKFGFEEERRGPTLLVIAAVIAAALAPETLVLPLVVGYALWGIAESVSPVMTEGILEGPSEEDGVEDTADSTRSYRPRSTWE